MSEMVLVESEGRPLPAEQHSGPNPALLVELAIKQNADVDKLERLMAMQERWDKAQQKKAFVAAMQKFKANPPKIFKDAVVDYSGGKGRVNYKFASLSNCCNQIDEAAAKFGLSFRWKPETLDSGIVRVTCIVSHVDGHEEAVTLQAMPDQSGGKNGIQAVGSTISYLERYTLLAALGIAVQGKDDDGRHGQAGNERISDKQVEEVVALLNETHADFNRFCEAFQIAEVEELRAADFGKAIELLQKKKAGRK